MRRGRSRPPRLRRRLERAGEGPRREPVLRQAPAVAARAAPVGQDPRAAAHAAEGVRHGSITRSAARPRLGRRCALLDGADDARCWAPRPPPGGLGRGPGAPPRHAWREQREPARRRERVVHDREERDRHALFGWRSPPPPGDAAPIASKRVESTARAAVWPSAQSAARRSGRRRPPRAPARTPAGLRAASRGRGSRPSPTRPDLLGERLERALAAVLPRDGQADRHRADLRARHPRLRVAALHLRDEGVGRRATAGGCPRSRRSRRSCIPSAVQ